MMNTNIKNTLLYLKCFFLGGLLWGDDGGKYKQCTDKMHG